MTRVATASTGDQTIVNSGDPTLSYDNVSGKLLGWAGGSDVYALDLSTHNWEKVAAAAGNPVTPTDPTAAGVFGRWRYVPAKNVFVVVNAINENVFVYKYADSGTGLSSRVSARSRLSLQVNPNPMSARTRITVRGNITEPLTVEIFNAHGRLVETVPFIGNGIVWSVPAMPNGVYLLQAGNHKQRMHKKLFIMR